MKRKFYTLIAIIIYILIAKSSFAQSNFGVIGGLNLTDMKDNLYPSYYDTKLNTGYHFGVFIQRKFSNQFFISEYDLLLDQKGMKREYSITTNGVTSSGSLSMTPLYIEAPGKIIHKIDLKNGKIELFLGLSIGVLIGGNINTTSTIDSAGHITSISTTKKIRSDLNDGNLKFMDAMFNLGTSYEYRDFILRIQYGFSLINIYSNDISGISQKNRVFSISIGYLLHQGIF